MSPEVMTDSIGQSKMRFTDETRKSCQMRQPFPEYSQYRARYQGALCAAPAHGYSPSTTSSWVISKSNP